MAKFILTNAYFELNSIDLSDHVESIAFNYEAESLDSTGFGDDTRINLGGLKNWSAEIKLRQDFASSSVDSTIFPLMGTVVTYSIKADDTTRDLTGNCLLTKYSPIQGTTGEAANAALSIVSAGALV